jgi:hypothetical protein
LQAKTPFALLDLSPSAVILQLTIFQRVTISAMLNNQENLCRNYPEVFTPSQAERLLVEVSQYSVELIHI